GGDALWRVAFGRGLIEERAVCEHIDGSDLGPVVTPPVRREDATGGGEEVGADLADGCGDPERSEGGPEHLRGQVLGVASVADPAVHDAVEPFDVVQVDRLPAGVGGGVDAPQARNRCPVTRRFAVAGPSCAMATTRV